MIPRAQAGLVATASLFTPLLLLPLRYLWNALTGEFGASPQGVLVRGGIAVILCSVAATASFLVVQLREIDPKVSRRALQSLILNLLVVCLMILVGGGSWLYGRKKAAGENRVIAKTSTELQGIAGERETGESWEDQKERLDRFQATLDEAAGEVTGPRAALVDGMSRLMKQSRDLAAISVEQGQAFIDGSIWDFRGTETEGGLETHRQNARAFHKAARDLRDFQRDFVKHFARHLTEAGAAPEVVAINIKEIKKNDTPRLSAELQDINVEQASLVLEMVTYLEKRHGRWSAHPEAGFVVTEDEEIAAQLVEWDQRLDLLIEKGSEVEEAIQASIASHTRKALPRGAR